MWCVEWIHLFRHKVCLPSASIPPFLSLHPSLPSSLPPIPSVPPSLLLASFPGHRGNSLATSTSSNCIRMLRHGNCNTSLQQTSACDTYNFFSCENGAFLLVEATVCCWFYYWSEIEVIRTKIIVQNTYTTAIERSLLKWNGCDCDGSYALCKTVVMWLRSEIWLVLLTFRQEK